MHFLNIAYVSMDVSINFHLFHFYLRFPKDTEWADKWEKKLKEFNPNYVRKVDDKICSLHFAKSSMNPTTRQLQDHAIPVNFPQLKEALQTNTNGNILATCCIDSCNTKFTVDSKIHGFKYVFEWA